MRRLIGVKELRELLESDRDIYRIMDTLNDMARVYASEVTIEVIQAGAERSKNRLATRHEPKRIRT
jgi:hypothetical protein|tara:strand:- start:97 stop:294 length:198 start_codon:yes stop_codon:yes gene_type:complete